MHSNFKRAVSLMLLASAANIAFAAPAPVSNINSSSSNTSLSQSTPETDIQRLERMVANRATVQLQLQQQLDDLVIEISELRGLIERNSYDNKQVMDRQRQLFIDLDNLRNEMKESAKAAAAAPAADASAADGSDSGTFTSDLDEEVAYKSAVDLILKDRDYAGAITAFKEFQQDFPESSFMANSHYWLGQLYFAQKEDVEAAKSFTAVAKFKDSAKRADAILKLGDIASRNDKPMAAKKYYNQVIEEYPESASADLARNHLK